jgi:hypothetical protein
MKSRKLISAVAAFSMAVSSFTGILTANAEDTETVYNFSTLTESSYSKSGASVFDGALTISGTDSAKPVSVNAAIAAPSGATESVTSALIAKQLAVKVHLDAGETVVEYYCGSDSGAANGKAIDVVVKNASGETVASESNAENKNGVKPYVIYYKAETAGDYTIAESSTGTNRTIVYAVAKTTGTYTPTADVTAAPATADPSATATPTAKPKETVDPSITPSINIEKSTGWLETAYATWTSQTAVSSFNVYVKPENGEYTKIDDELVRYYGSYYRADAMGLKAGNYQMKIVPVINGAEITDAAKETGVLEVKAGSRGLRI